MQNYITPEKTITDIDTVYSDSKLQRLAEKPMDFSKLTKHAKIEYCKEVSEDFYRVVLRSESSYVLLYYENNECIIQDIYSPVFTKEDFLSTIVNGLSVYEVKDIDPIENYKELYTGRTEPKETVHLTTDGYMCVVTYDDDWRVKSIDTSIL